LQRQEPIETLRALTIRLLYSATPSNPNAAGFRVNEELSVHSYPLAAISLVAQVFDIRVATTSTTFTLQDGVNIEARTWKDADDTEMDERERLKEEGIE
jgi:hypothetical protein